MTETSAADDNTIEIYRHLSDQTAILMRKAIAAMGFPAHCSFKACRRSRTCATRDLLCWQVNHEEMNRVIRLAAAHRWRDGPKPGEDGADPSPQQVREHQRLLAEEAAGERDTVRDKIVGQVEETTS